MNMLIMIGIGAVLFIGGIIWLGKLTEKSNRGDD